MVVLLTSCLSLHNFNFTISISQFHRIIQTTIAEFWLSFWILIVFLSHHLSFSSTNQLSKLKLVDCASMTFFFFLFCWNFLRFPICTDLLPLLSCRDSLFSCWLCLDFFSSFTDLISSLISLSLTIQLWYSDDPYNDKRRTNPDMKELPALHSKSLICSRYYFFCRVSLNVNVNPGQDPVLWLFCFFWRPVELLKQQRRLQLLLSMHNFFYQFFLSNIFPSKVFLFSFFPRNVHSLEKYSFLRFAVSTTDSNTWWIFFPLVLFHRICSQPKPPLED